MKNMKLQIAKEIVKIIWANGGSFVLLIMFLPISFMLFSKFVLNWNLLDSMIMLDVTFATEVILSALVYISKETTKEAREKVIARNQTEELAVSRKLDLINDDLHQASETISNQIAHDMFIGKEPEMAGLSETVYDSSIIANSIVNPFKLSVKDLKKHVKEHEDFKMDVRNVIPMSLLYPEFVFLDHNYKIKIVVCTSKKDAKEHALNNLWEVLGPL